jgi:hypothetical protein
MNTTEFYIKNKGRKIQINGEYGIISSRKFNWEKNEVKFFSISYLDGGYIYDDCYIDENGDLCVFSLNLIGDYKSEFVFMPKFDIGETICMKDNKDYEITIVVIEENENGFVYYEGSDFYAASIEEKNSVLVKNESKNSIFNTYEKIINE